MRTGCKLDELPCDCLHARILFRDPVIRIFKPLRRLRVGKHALRRDGCFHALQPFLRWCLSVLVLFVVGVVLRDRDDARGLPDERRNVGVRRCAPGADIGVVGIMLPMPQGGHDGERIPLRFQNERGVCQFRIADDECAISPAFRIVIPGILFGIFHMAANDLAVLEDRECDVAIVKPDEFLFLEILNRALINAAIDRHGFDILVGEIVDARFPQCREFVQLFRLLRLGRGGGFPVCHFIRQANDATVFHSLGCIFDDMPGDDFGSFFEIHGLDRLDE